MGFDPILKIEIFIENLHFYTGCHVNSRIYFQYDTLNYLHHQLMTF